MVGYTMEGAFYDDDRGRLINLVPEFLVARIYLVQNWTHDTIRGDHMHKNEMKAFAVICGAARIIITSENRDVLYDTVLTPNGHLIQVHPGEWMSWQGLAPGTILMGLSSASKYDKEDDHRRSPRPEMFIVEDR